MEDRVKKIIADILGISPNEIKEDSSPDPLEVWDSLNHMNIMMAVESEFNISLTEEEMMDLMSYRSIVDIVGEKV